MGALPPARISLWQAPQYTFLSHVPCTSGVSQANLTQPCNPRCSQDGGETGQGGRGGGGRCGAQVPLGRSSADTKGLSPMPLSGNLLAPGKHRSGDPIPGEAWEFRLTRGLPGVPRGPLGPAAAPPEPLTLGLSPETRACRSRPLGSAGVSSLCPGRLVAAGPTAGCPVANVPGQRVPALQPPRFHGDLWSFWPIKADLSLRRSATHCPPPATGSGPSGQPGVSSQGVWCQAVAGLSCQTKPGELLAGFLLCVCSLLPEVVLRKLSCRSSTRPALLRVSQGGRSAVGFHAARTPISPGQPAAQGRAEGEVWEWGTVYFPPGDKPGVRGVEVGSWLRDL